MGKEWLSWVGGGGNSRPSTKRDKMAAGCMFHLFHFHFLSSHRHTSYPFLQEEPTTTTGVEAPRNSLERQEQDLNFPVGIRIKTSKAKALKIDESDDSPGTKTPSVVARLMGLDLLPQCSSPSTQIDAARSLPETPRTSSDVERHRLSLDLTNKENAYDGRRFKKDDSKRNRSVGLDITNIHKNSDQSKKISKIVEKVKQSNAPKVHNPRRVVTNQIPLKESKRVRVKKLPASRREDGFLACRERNKTHNKCKIGPPPTNLPPKKSQVSEDGVICSAQLSSKSYRQLQLRQDKTPAPHGGVSPEHRNYIKMILNHTAIAKCHSPSQPINPGIFHHLELNAAGLSHRSERKLVFQLVDELMDEILTRQLKLKPRVPHFGGGSRMVEELCKKMGSFPAKKCEVLEDIDSLIDMDLCEAQWDRFWGGEEMVSEIEGEIVEWLVREAVAVMGGDAAEEMVFVM